MFPSWYNDYKKKIDLSIVEYLNLYFEKKSEDFWSLNEQHSTNVLKNFSESVYYATKWGKRIRAIFALEFYLIMSWKKFEEISFEDDIIKLCIAIEFLHAYSLVHDDLPAMDNDIYRRWEFTTWKKYWETNGILVWDLLNSLAFETIWSLKNKEVWMELIKRFWQAVWFYWMIWWQVLDLYYEKNPNELNLQRLLETHNRKTGDLITFSIIWWVLLWVENSNLDFWKYLDFWKKIWLAFQVKDDLLDVEWSFEEVGKSVWWEKKWFIHLIWVEKSKEYLQELIADTLENIKDLNSPKLDFLVGYVGSRKK
jgi:geranylgeranyl diphosphate synthase type II